MQDLADYAHKAEHDDGEILESMFATLVAMWRPASADCVRLEGGADAWLERLQASYAMEEERDRHAGRASKAARPNSRGEFF